jgi:uncharacterized membrane protein
MCKLRCNKIIGDDRMAEVPMPESSIPPQTVSSERPGGIFCLTCLMMLNGILDLVIGSSVPYYFILGLANIVVGIFLYKLQPWAWMAAIIMNLIFLIINIISIIGILGAIVNLIVLIYLNQQNVKIAFRQKVDSKGVW